jgi:hypothetical protein
MFNIDVDVENPDEKSLMTYVSMLYNVIPNVPPHPSELKQESVRILHEKLEGIKNFKKSIF